MRPKKYIGPYWTLGVKPAVSEVWRGRMFPLNEQQDECLLAGGFVRRPRQKKNDVLKNR